MYEEFQDVGLMTGDVTINPNASVIIMTTEVYFFISFCFYVIKKYSFIANLFTIFYSNLVMQKYTL